MAKLRWLALVGAVAAGGCTHGGDMMGMPGGMNVSRTAAWTSLADSLDRDGAEMPYVPGDSLLTRMREHAERMHRLFRLHEDMMREMMGH